MAREPTTTLSMRGTSFLIQNLETIEQKFGISRNAAARLVVRSAASSCPLSWKDLAKPPAAPTSEDGYIPTTLTLVVEKSPFNRLVEDFKREYPDQRRIVSSFIFRLALQYAISHLDKLVKTPEAAPAEETDFDFTVLRALLRFLESPNPQDLDLRNCVLEALRKYQ